MIHHCVWRGRQEGPAPHLRHWPGLGRAVLALIEQLYHVAELALAAGLAAVAVFGIACFVAGVIVTLRREMSNTA